MITTIDGFIVKRYGIVWEIGSVIRTYKKKPSRSKVHQDLSNPNRCWKSYDLCLEECNKLNIIEHRKKIYKLILNK